MRLLLVEDNARLASLLADGLAKEGFAVDWCATLDLATRAFASTPTTWCCSISACRTATA
jgi:DNA-binding response OmpR family regulator